jgi:hypothetical protein
LLSSLGSRPLREDMAYKNDAPVDRVLYEVFEDTSDEIS